MIFKVFLLDNNVRRFNKKYGGQSAGHHPQRCSLQTNCNCPEKTKTSGHLTIETYTIALVITVTRTVYKLYLIPQLYEMCPFVLLILLIHVIP